MIRGIEPLVQDIEPEQPVSSLVIQSRGAVHNIRRPRRFRGVVRPLVALTSVTSLMTSRTLGLLLRRKLNDRRPCPPGFPKVRQSLSISLAFSTSPARVVGCGDTNRSLLCHDPAPIFHFPPPPQVTTTTPSPPATQPAHAQQVPVRRQSPANIPLPPSPPPMDICPPSPPHPTLAHLMPQSDIPNLADAYMQTVS